MGNYRFARVRQRCVGSLFFSIFGSIWLLMGMLAFGLLNRWTILLWTGCLTVFVSLAVRWMRAFQGAEPEPAREAEGQQFAMVNAAQGVLIFLAFLVANLLHRPDVAFPVAVLIVGLHIFVLPATYRTPSNLTTGVLLVSCALVCFVVLRGNTMAGAVTAGAGIILWLSAAHKLLSAYRLQHDSPVLPFPESAD